MFLEDIFKIAGWTMFLGPVIVALTISFYMFRGAAKDDNLINVFLILGLTIFFIGLGILVLFYLTDYGTSLISQ